MTPEVWNAFLTLIGALILFLLGALLKKLNDRTKTKISFVLEIVENFVKANPDIIQQPWSKFKKKIETTIEKYIKIDLTDEQWNLFWEELYKVYAKLKQELQQPAE